MTQSIWSTSNGIGGQGLFDLLGNLGPTNDIAAQNAEAAALSSEHTNENFFQALTEALNAPQLQTQNPTPQSPSHPSGEDLSFSEMEIKTEESSFPLALLTGNAFVTAPILPQQPQLQLQQATHNTRKTEVLFSQTTSTQPPSPNLTPFGASIPSQGKTDLLIPSKAQQQSPLPALDLLNKENIHESVQAQIGDEAQLQSFEIIADDASALQNLSRPANSSEEIIRELPEVLKTQNTEFTPKQEIELISRDDDISSDGQKDFFKKALPEFVRSPSTEKGLTSKTDNAQAPKEQFRILSQSPNSVTAVYQAHTPKSVHQHAQTIHQSDDGKSFAIENRSESFYSSEGVHPHGVTQSELKDQSDSNEKNDDNEKTSLFSLDSKETRESKTWVAEHGKNDTKFEATSALSRATLERSRDMATQLQGRGGTARIQISDAKFGTVKLEIRVEQGNKVFVEVRSGSAKLKEELRDNMEALKQSLDDRRMSLAEFKFTVDNAISTQASTNTNTQQQQQNERQRNEQQAQQFFQSSTNSDGSNRQFLGGQNSNADQNSMNFTTNSLSQAARSKNFARSTTANLERQTNIQRSANGSLKVRA